MAKQKYSKSAIVKDFRTVRLGHAELIDKGAELRIDVTDEQVRAAASRLRDRGLLKVREHAAGDKLWRVSLTDAGLGFAPTVIADIQRDINEMEQTRAATESELKKRKEERDQRRLKALSEADDPWAGGGIEPIPVPEGLALNTQTLHAFNAHATAKGLSRVLTAEQVGTLHPNGQHRVRQAWHHTSHEGYTNARTTMTLEVGPSVIDRAAEPMTVESTMDFLDEDWDLLMAPYKQAQRESGFDRANGQADGIYLVAPTWEATRSYRVVHELHSFFQGHVSGWNAGYHQSFVVPGEYGGLSTRLGGRYTRISAKDAKDFLSHPRALLGAETSEMMHTAHPLVIDPEWVEIQENWTLSEAFAYGNRLVLPYDPLYLDLEGVGGRMPYVTVSVGKDGKETKVPLSGCLFWTDAETGRLVVNPMGGRTFLDFIYETNLSMSGYPYEQTGRVLLGGPLYPDNDIVTPAYQIVEEETESRSMPVEATVYQHRLAIGDLQNEFTAVQLPTPRDIGEDIPFGVEPDGIPGYSEIPLIPSDAEATKAFPNEDGQEIPMMIGWNRVLLYQAAKCLSLMSLLDNENVELRESTSISRQVRRHAKRKGHGIASEIVVVRKQRYINGEKVSEGDEREYSHQFRVRRHEQHHGPHTPAYRAHPEKAKPCARCGSCRRFIVESYIKGPADKPLKDHKTYVFRDKKDE